MHGFVHFFGRNDRHCFDTVRGCDRSGAGNERHIGSRFQGGLRNGVALLAGAAVGDAAHGIQCFKGGTGRDNEALTLQNLRRKQARGVCCNLFGLNHSACARNAARKLSARGSEHGKAVGLELSDVALSARFGPHIAVHCRTYGNRTGACENNGTHQVVGKAVGGLGQDVGGGRRDDQQVAVARERQVLHRAVKGLGLYRMS